MMALECVPTLLVPFLKNAMRQHRIPATAKHIHFHLVEAAGTENVAVNMDPIKMLIVCRNVFR